MTDIILTNFVSSTGVDPAVAQDILDSHEWDLERALKSFSDLKSGKPLPSPSLETGGFKRPEVGRIGAGGKALLQKNDAVEVADESTGRKWSRGISTASENLALVTRARSDVARRFTSDDPGCVPNHTFTLPDLTAIQPDEFRAFVENDLIETATLVSLEQAGRLNWWSDTRPCQRLLPLATTGDGNCLLHAASLGIWGFHDRLLTLRKSLNHVLSKSEYGESIYRRWRWHQTILNKQSGLIYTEPEWEKEWFGILKLSSAEPRIKSRPYICCDNSPNRNLAIVEETDDLGDEYNTQYESLEEVHVFALAYAIKRPVIVIADVYLRDSAGEPLAPIPFGGIYLPLGCDPKYCLRSPLILTYDAAHFSALVPMKKDSTEGSELPAVIPVTDSHGDLLPVLFLIDPGESFDWGREDRDPQVVEKLTGTSQEDKLQVVQMYLDLVKVTVSVKPKESISSTSGGVDDRRSTADSNESESSSGSRIEKAQKSGFSKQMKSVRQKLKRSISKLTRRTSEDSDVTVAMRGTVAGHGDGPFEKNLNGPASARGQPPPQPSVMHHSEISLHVNGNGRTNVVYENTGYRWTVEAVKDLHDSDVLHNPGIVLGSPLSLDHETSFHEEMISNYLAAARVRFDNHLKDKERRDNLHVQNGKTRCASPGCDAFGTPSTNYLCPACFAKQKVQLEEMKAQRETTTIGKSTFYTNNGRNEDGDEVLLNNQRSLTPRGGILPQLQRPNAVVEGISTIGKSFPGGGDDVPDAVVRPCRTANCVFFGQEKTDFLCSMCFKQKNHTCLLLPPAAASAAGTAVPNTGSVDSTTTTNLR
ncbi:OTU domain-containing protein 7B [Hypsibius exemplaris]|uniref:ubiquitinyl hydrolase 1 n=1 Tax=Hypsibius exemplaris TaxID=2072580 RepID=A0A9X6NIG3_HYPEX|nr:OTU domain-containing protein 7B [Hypsibius exemplaris]